MPTRIDLVEDVLPISELRLRAAQQITKIQETQRPLVITQYGKAVAVLMEVAQFQTWQDRLTHLEEKVVDLEKQLATANAAKATDKGQAGHAENASAAKKQPAPAEPASEETASAGDTASDGPSDGVGSST